MAEAVAGLLTSAFVDIAKDKLGSAIAEQANLLWNFSGDLEDMKENLETISAALEDAESQSVKEKLVRLWLKRLKHAAWDISDILDDNQDITTHQATAKIPRLLSCIPMEYKKIVMANRMKSIRENLRKICKEFNSFNFRQGTCTNIEQHYDERETTSYLPEERIIGRDGEKQEIINLLSAKTTNDEIVIVPIYGLGGMGKSTLAQLVYNDYQFKKYDHRIWVYVSQDFNLLKIGSSMISQLPSGGQQNRDTLQMIKECLGNLLRDKKALVVLDDLWEEKNIELDKLRSMLHVKGSMVDVIVTTRKEEIARKVGTNKPYNLRPLTDDICWEIIKSYSKFNQKSNQEIFEKIGLDIAKKCGGMALAAQAIGFMLQSINDLSGWEKINNCDIWNESSEGNNILPSLKLSYERIPRQLRICFSYCAIFPKGHNIVEDDLVHQWVAMDFINQSKGKEYIKILLGMSFLQVSKLPSTSKEHVMQYTMHDLVHDLARMTMADELTVLDVTLDRDTRDQKYCRFSLVKKYDGEAKLGNILSSKMRALHFSHSGKLDVSNSAFSFARYLRSLDFSECSGILLPASVGRLKHLRCLIAPRMQNECLPKFITKLSKLQYLNLNESSRISVLPESIGNLGCLEYLGLSRCSGLSKLPESFGGLKCMVHLNMSSCSGIRELPGMLGNLTNLQHLDLSGCSSLREIPESFCGLTQLQYLNLSSCGWLDRLPQAIGNLINLLYLNMSYCHQVRVLPKSLTKLQNLLQLDLSACHKIRELGGLCGLTALQHLDMSQLWGSAATELDALGHLTSLKYLSLRNCITGSLHMEGNDMEFFGTLTSLEHLNLSYNYGLGSLPESIGNLRRLHTLDLTDCKGLKSLPGSIGAIGLKSLVLTGCSDEVMDQASSLVHYSRTLPVFKVRPDDINGCSNLHLIEDAHHVRELRIFCLENARSLDEAKRVKLVDKHKLSNLTLAWNVDAVRHVDDNDLLGQLVPPRGLKSMCLQGYSSTSFPSWLMGISHYLTCLVSIHLRDLPTCTNLPPLGQLPHLGSLTLRNLSSIQKIDREFCGGKGAFPRLSDLFISQMKALVEWNTTYSVEDGVEEFMFPVLDRLMIQDCPGLSLKPCPPTFRDGHIWLSEQVISSLEEADKISHPSSRCRTTKLFLSFRDNSCDNMRMFHHFPGLKELDIFHPYLTSLPESMRQLTSLQSLTLNACGSISTLPEWLGELFSLEIITLYKCQSITSLPSCIHQLTKLEKLEVSSNQELKKWCESEENKTKLTHINIVYDD